MAMTYTQATELFDDMHRCDRLTRARIELRAVELCQAEHPTRETAQEIFRGAFIRAVEEVLL
jgi:hypothetical protein